jgi:hypothetical protein
LFHEDEKEEEEVVVEVVGMEYLLSVADVGCKFSVFLGLVVGGDGIFCVSCGCWDGRFSVFAR